MAVSCEYLDCSRCRLLPATLVVLEISSVLPSLSSARLAIPAEYDKGFPLYSPHSWDRIYSKQTGNRDKMNAGKEIDKLREDIQTEKKQRF